MTNAELEEVICGLHRRIALTTAGTPLQDDLIKAVGALRIAVKRIAELEAQLPKMCEFKSYADKIPNARNRYCTQCGAYFSDEEFENHTIRYCYYCGSKVKGEHDGETEHDGES